MTSYTLRPDIFTLNFKFYSFRYTYNEPQQTVQSIQNMHDNGFIEYLPYKVKNRLY